MVTRITEGKYQSLGPKLTDSDHYREMDWLDFYQLELNNVVFISVILTCGHP